jgi:hypothetical protein
MREIISGALVMGYFVASLFFLRFWKESRDRLFLAFSFAFVLLGAQRLALSLSPDPNDAPLLFYGLRLLAFLVILAAIVDKNRA